MFHVSLSPSGRSFEAGPADTLLEAAEFAGIALESSCRNGTCRTCILRVSHGEARHMIEWPGLSADEKRQGWILPCVAHAATHLELVAPAIR
ncbi:MAG: 2Fe-2S iron-sulfur cluster binding domain-containing protein [Burkholderiaceae bacterium]|nr:2Fe-2S iron-sulfur cluster binding domain-containing protein [Burkholderiaceae bacterium]